MPSRDRLRSRNNFSILIDSTAEKLDVILSIGQGWGWKNENGKK